jgi:hypothetical protein
MIGETDRFGKRAGLGVQNGKPKWKKDGSLGMENCENPPLQVYFIC